VWRKRTGRPLNGHNPLTSSILRDMVHLSDLRQPRAKGRHAMGSRRWPLREPFVLMVALPILGSMPSARTLPPKIRDPCRQFQGGVRRNLRRCKHQRMLYAANFIERFSEGWSVSTQHPWCRVEPINERCHARCMSEQALSELQGMVAGSVPACGWFSMRWPSSATLAGPIGTLLGSPERSPR
jgi:hypothetical protein